MTDGINAKLQHNGEVNAHTGDQHQGLALDGHSCHWASSSAIEATCDGSDHSSDATAGTLTQQEFKCNCEQDAQTHYHILTASKITQTTYFGPPQNPHQQT